MANITFTRQQINQFDRIERCLQEEQCAEVFELYLKRTRNNNLLKVLKLFREAVGRADEDDMSDLIDAVRGFNADPLLSLAEGDQKLHYIKSECYRLLGEHDTHVNFIKYLTEYHVQ